MISSEVLRWGGQVDSGQHVLHADASILFSIRVCDGVP